MKQATTFCPLFFASQRGFEARNINMLTLRRVAYLFVLVLALSDRASPHKTIKTEAEKEVQRSLQRAAYYVRVEIFGDKHFIDC